MPASAGHFTLAAAGPRHGVATCYPPKMQMRCEVMKAMVTSQACQDIQYARSVMPMLHRAWRRPSSFSWTTRPSWGGGQQCREHA